MSLASTGVAVIKGNDVDLHTIKTRKQDFRFPFLRRELIIAKVSKLIPEGSYICIEKGFTALKNFSGQDELTTLNQNTRDMLDRQGLNYIKIAPNQLKKYATGKGNTKGKQAVIDAVCKLWGVYTKDDNQADACVLAKIAQALDSANTEPLEHYQEDVLDAIMNPEVKKTAKKKRARK